MRSLYVVMTLLFPGLGHIVKGEHAKGVALAICYALPVQGFLYSTYVWRDMWEQWFSLVCLALAAALWVVALVDIARRLYFVDEDAVARERDRLFHEGVVAYLRGDLNRAEDTLHTMLKRDRDDADGWVQLAMVYKGKGDIVKARKALRRCRSIDDAEKWAWETEQEKMQMGLS